jgi:hypothetical protein
MRQIADWLREIGLEQYAQRFAENDIDFRVLPDLTDQDLKDLGVASLGHRRLLLRAITELKVEKEDHIRHRTCFIRKGCRASPSHGDVLRLGRLNGPLGPDGP